MTRAFGTGLRERLVGAVLLLLVGLLATLATLVVVRSAQALEEIDELRAQAAVDQLAESAATGVLARSTLLLEAPLDAFDNTPELLEVRIVDDKGQVLAERRRPRAASAAPDARFSRRASVRLDPVLPGLEGELDDAIDPFVEPGASASPDAGVHGPAEGGAAHEVIGEVIATFGRSETARIQRRTRNDMVIAFVGLGALGLLLVWLVATSVVRRIRGLANAASAVAGGDLAVRVDDDGRDELSELGKSFNRMAEALEDQRSRLKEAGDELAASESLAAIGRATAVIAHELKNPLGILLGAADISKDPDRPEAQRQKAGAIISEEVKRLDATIKQLLGYARPRAPDRQPTAARDLLEHAARRATLPGGPAAEIAVEVTGADVPGATVLIDEPQIAQVLLNLVANAAQAGAEHIALHLSLASDEPAAEGSKKVGLVVDDNGPGVSDDILPRLFQPFVTSKQRGAGLGLAGSRRLCRDNGGDLRYEGPSPLGGARFVISLPVQPDVDPQPKETA
jgi:signal transduction histidine kinase